MVIQPQRGWWDLRLGELRRYRDLVLLVGPNSYCAIGMVDLGFFIGCIKPGE